MNWRSAGIALRTYLVPLPRSRAFLLTLAGVGLILLTAILSRLASTSAAAPGHLAAELARTLVFPVMPIVALLVSELPLREGIRHRTLLYPLLGPVPRPMLALVRTTVTAVGLGVGLGLVVFAVSRLGGRPAGEAWGLALAAGLGGLAYVGLFGLIQVLAARGLIAALVWYFLLDEPLSWVPFELCRLSVAYHVRVLAGTHEFMKLPVELPTPEPSTLLSAAALLLAGALSTGLTVHFFTRKDLGDLC